MKLVRKFLSIFKIKFVKTNHKAFEPMRYAFTGISGHKYYCYRDVSKDINPARYIQYYLKLNKEYSLEVRKQDILDFIEMALNISDVKRIHAAIYGLKSRVEINHPDHSIIYELMAVLYLRGDEPNEEVPESLIREKAQDIKETMKISGAIDNGFFLCGEFRNFLKREKLLGINWNEYTAISEKQNQIFKTLLEMLEKEERLSKNTTNLQKKLIVN